MDYRFAPVKADQIYQLFLVSLIRTYQTILAFPKDARDLLFLSFQNTSDTHITIHEYLVATV
jgi:hypothetical protein